jgi:hypothetical protein
MMMMDDDNDTGNERSWRMMTVDEVDNDGE